MSHVFLMVRIDLSVSLRGLIAKSKFPLFFCTLSQRNSINVTIRSMIHFELIFMKSVRCIDKDVWTGTDIDVSCLHMHVQLFQQHLLKACFFAKFHWQLWVPISGFPIISL